MKKMTNASIFLFPDNSAKRRKCAATPVKNRRDVVAIARAALKVIAGASFTTSALLVLQLAWIAWRTPRLPPPPLSGVDFVRDGRVVQISDDDRDDDRDDEKDDDEIDDVRSNYDVMRERAKCTEASNKVAGITNRSGGIAAVAAHRKPKEFRLVLIGDSPVEGIGNARHENALGGRTARAFARLVCKEGYDRVRYWSYGKSGLTARGIEEDIVPLLARVTKDVRKSSTSLGGHFTEPAIHAIILLCGVNNVLDPWSTATSFRSEVHSLLNAIRRCHRTFESTPLIVLGLPDFAGLPFLPRWPLGIVLGFRGRKMQSALESVVKEFQQKDEESGFGKLKVIMVKIPEVREVLGTIGYHRHDSYECNIDGTGDRDENSISCPLEMRLCHPLMKYLRGSTLDQSKLGSLSIKDFLCDDGFHPGRYGTMYIGHLIAEAYRNAYERRPLWQNE